MTLRFAAFFCYPAAGRGGAADNPNSAGAGVKAVGAVRKGLDRGAGRL
ncbi:hypothetical protein [Butyrivibrio sp. FCS014]|nr:hypothetical protein [Butyrivibrio sp. FCS014]